MRAMKLGGSEEGMGGVGGERSGKNYVNTVLNYEILRKNKFLLVKYNECILFLS